MNREPDPGDQKETDLHQPLPKSHTSHPLKDCYPDTIRRMESELRVGLGIRVGVKILEMGSLPRWDHKAPF
ncbi:MAG: hypothetical protein ACE5JO_10335 [Candidatus Binatia bacterium]